MIQLPRLLDENLKEKARLSPVKLAIHQRLSGLSTAEMILPPEENALHLRDLVKLYDENASIGVYRVTKITTDESFCRTVRLEHALGILQDSVVPAQGFMCGVSEALTRLLDCQSVPRWTTGVVEAPEDLTVIFATEYISLLEAVNALVGMLPEGYTLDFNFALTPWRLNIRALDTNFCEGRLSRNVLSVRHQVDGSRLCTRVYPFGAELDTGRISLVPMTGSDHLDAAHPDMPISRCIESDLIFDVPTLHTVAQMYLDRHGNPDIMTVVNALDLYQATREPLDRIQLGKTFRPCLPDLGLTVHHRIVAIDKPDIIGDPGHAVVTLSNRLKPQSDADEVAELVRLTTAGKLLGGSVVTLEQRNYANGTYSSPVVHYFNIEDWPALLDARVTITLPVGATLRDVRVDGSAPEDDVWKSGTFSLMPYLRRDELGTIAKGQHQISMLPYGSSASASVGVTSVITLTIIENTTT